MPTPTTTTTAPIATANPELVGTWVGPLEGGTATMMASGTMTLVLNADGTMSATNSNPQFHPINEGTWSVEQDRFSARGDDILGTLVEFSAPYSTTVLDGTWTTGAASGTFVVTKQ